jgi:hypothetical protein
MFVAPGKSVIGWFGVHLRRRGHVHQQQVEVKMQQVGCICLSVEMGGLIDRKKIVLLCEIHY